MGRRIGRFGEQVPVLAGEPGLVLDRWGAVAQRHVNPAGIRGVDGHLEVASVQQPQEVAQSARLLPCLLELRQVEGVEVAVAGEPVRVEDQQAEQGAGELVGRQGASGVGAGTSRVGTVLRARIMRACRPTGPAASGEAVRWSMSTVSAVSPSSCSRMVRAGSP